MGKVLVTGGAGFLGSHVAAGLIANGHDVTVLDDLSGGFPDNVPRGAAFVHGSVTDVDLVQRLCETTRFDYVYHLAAYAAESLSHFIKRFNYTTNLLGSVTLINAAINTGVKCFVFTSSIAVYGNSDVLPMTEETPAHPEDSYGIAKLAVEQELRACKPVFGLDSIIFRPHNVYGECQNIGDRYRNVVGIFMNQVAHDRPMTIAGDGTQRRAFSYVGDVAPIIAQAIDVPAAYNQVFNIGADEPCTINELAVAVAEAMGVARHVVHLPARHEVACAYASHERVRQVFGVRQPHSLEQGLRRMAAWVKRHGARPSRPFTGVEITRSLRDAWWG